MKWKYKFARAVAVLLVTVALLVPGSQIGVVSTWVIALTALVGALPYLLSFGPRLTERATAITAAATALAWTGVLAAAFNHGTDWASILAVSGLVGLFFLNFAEFNDKNVRTCLRAPLATAAALWFALAGFWQVAQREQNEYLHTLVEQSAEDADHMLSATVDELSHAITRYARRVEYLGFRDQEFLRIDSEMYLKQLPILRRIGVTDPALNVLWSYPENLAHQVHGYNQGVDPKRRAAFDEAARMQTPMLSSHIRMISGDTGFILPISLRRKGKAIGFLYATLDADALIHHALPSEDFRVEVSEAGLRIYPGENEKVPPAAHADVRAYAHEGTMSVGLSKWHVRVEPTDAFIARNRSLVPLGFLLVGFAITLILWGTLRASALANWQNTRNSEWRKALLNSADYAIISYDAHGNIQTFNRAAERLLGYAATDVIGRLSPKVFHVEDELFARRMELEREFDRPIEDGLEILTAKAAIGLADEYEWTLRRRDGRRVPTTLSMSALKDGHGEIYGFLGIIIDLTERQRAKEALRLAHARLERVVEASGEGFWERDFLTREVYFIDSRARELFGLKPEETVSYELIVRNIPTEDRERLSQGIAAHVREGSREFNVEFKIFNQNLGEERWMRALGRVQTAPGQSPRLISTIRDVTDVVRSRERLQAALIRAEDATRAKSAFLASMSHEIRTPLNGVIGMADVLLGTPLTDEQRNYVEIVNQSGTALLRLINDVLDFSKIEAGKMELDEAPYDLASLVENQASLLAARAKAANIMLATFISPALPEQIYGDATRVGQILLNLMGNAIKFTSRGGIVVSATPCDLGVRFAVRDTGRGIAPENCAKLFRPFVQETSAIAGEYGGTGLGLSISKQFAELMGGQIGVDSEPGKGSIFWFEIPLRAVLGAMPTVFPFQAAPVIPRALIGDLDPFTAEVVVNYLRAWRVQTVNGSNQAEGAFELGFVSTPARTSALRTVLIAGFGAKFDEADLKEKGVASILRVPFKRAGLMAALKDERSVKTDRPEASAKIVSSGARLLVADDNSVNRQVAKSLLEALGHQVVLVNDGFQAIAAAGREEFDLILMDCQMPGMDGLDATREIRRLGHAMPIIALTANAGQEHVEQCYHAGMNAFLTKPIRRDRLAEALNPWLITKQNAA